MTSQQEFEARRAFVWKDKDGHKIDCPFCTNPQPVFSQKESALSWAAAHVARHRTSMTGHEAALRVRMDLLKQEKKRLIDEILVTIGPARLLRRDESNQILNKVYRIALMARRNA